MPRVSLQFFPAIKRKTMDRQWMKIKNRLDRNYLAGVRSFMTQAKAHISIVDGLIHCLCNKCLNNARRLEPDRGKAHLEDFGINKMYTTWYLHGGS